MAIRQETLRNKAYNYNQRLDEAKYTNLGGVKRTAFLCHSHKDETLVKGLIVILREQGIELYVDWLDHSMPPKPNKVTASNIQKKIKDSDIFLFLATENSKASRWCPWEIGYADASQKNIYIIPTSFGNEIYGNEYLEFYPYIDEGIRNSDKKHGYAIFESSTEGKWLSQSSLR